MSNHTMATYSKGDCALSTIEDATALLRLLDQGATIESAFIAGWVRGRSLEVGQAPCLQIGLVEPKRQDKTLVYFLAPLGMDIHAHMRPGLRALRPLTARRVETEREAEVVATTMVALLKQEIENEYKRDWSGRVPHAWPMIVQFNEPELFRTPIGAPLVKRRAHVEQTYTFEFANQKSHVRPAIAHA